MTIINVRGTSGSGKSTLMRGLFKLATDAKPVKMFGARGTRPLVYQLRLPQVEKPVFVLGPYTSPCGGCDAITDYKNILPPLLTEFSKQGHVVFEGLLISGGYGSVGRKLGELRDSGQRVVFALLDTPLELCLERVAARRAARGVTEPLNPKNTEQKYKAAHASQKQIAEVYGHECILIPHKRPVKTVVGLLGLQLIREPKHD